MPDVRELRTDLGRFAATLGLPLSGWQLADAALDAVISVWLWGRQSGKSRTLALLALWWAFRRPRQLVLVVSGSGELGARRLLREVREAAEAWPPLRSSVERADSGLLSLSNGSEVRSVAASEGSVRGLRADLALADEAQLIEDGLLLSALLPTVTARPGARVVLAGTASVASGAFFDLARRAELGEEGMAFSCRASRLVGGGDAMPWQQPTVIEAMRRAMGAMRFDAEHRGLWASAADGFVSRELLDRCVADYRADELGTMHGPARAAAGVDWGWRRDRSALVAVGRLALPGRKLFGVRCARRWPAGHPIPEVVREVAGSPAHFSALMPELNSLGGPATDELRSLLARRPGWAGGAPPRRPFRLLLETGGPADEWHRARLDEPARPRRRLGFTTAVHGIHLSAQLKAAGYAALRSLVERQLLVIPAGAADLRAELLGLRVTLTETGERVEGASDDLADALMLALRPVRLRDGRHGTALGRLADERARLPGPDLPRGWRGDGAHVQTASGLRVPAAPAWQSVAGPEVTVPGAPAPTGEELERPIPLMRRAYE